MVEIGANGRAVLAKPVASSVVRRQDAPACYDMNASIYVWKRAALLSDERVVSTNTGLYVMPEERSIDIDTELDFAFVEFLASRGEANLLS